MATGFGTAWAVVSPQDVVMTTSEQMMAALQKNRAVLERDSDKIYDLVSSILLPNFDFDLIARWALGKHWRQANAEQRKRFTQEFRLLLVRTYAKVLLEYSGDKIHFPPSPTPAPDQNEATVRTEVKPQQGAPIAVNYRMHRKDGTWKVFDVTVDGVSLVTNYRNTFSSQIREKGMDGVIDELIKRNAGGSS
jgi:phospholipid transport system substrate-binding protein